MLHSAHRCERLECAYVLACKDRLDDLLRLIKFAARRGQITVRLYSNGTLRT